MKIGKEHVGKKVFLPYWREKDPNDYIEILYVMDGEFLGRNYNGEILVYPIDVSVTGHDWQIVEEECEHKVIDNQYNSECPECSEKYGTKGYDISELRKRCIEQLDKTAREMEEQNEECKHELDMSGGVVFSCEMHPKEKIVCPKCKKIIKMEELKPINFKRKPKTLLAPALLGGTIFLEVTKELFRSESAAKQLYGKDVLKWPAPQPNEQGYYEIEVGDEV